MQIKRSATARWEGSGKEGTGHVTTDSHTLKDTEYSFVSRFESGDGTNPEELVAAAHAGCYSMKLAFILGGAGMTPDSIETKATTVLDDGAIRQVHLHTTVRAAGLTAEQLQELATEAKDTCPISNSLSADISLEAHLG